MEQAGFMDNKMPTLQYMTRQIYNEKNLSRPLHKHKDLTELLFIYQGSGTYTVQNKKYPIETGDLLLYNCGDVHEHNAPANTMIGAYCFGFSDLQLHGLPPNHLVPAGKSPVYRIMDNFSWVRDTCQQIFELMAEDNALSAVRSNILAASLVLMAHQLTQRSDHMLQSEEYTLVNRIKTYIDENYTEPLTLDNIAEVMSVSPYYASHLFKEAIGCPVIQYVIRRRIGEAQSLLISTDYSITQIGAMVGYDNPNYFSTIFSKVTGETPARYRIRYLEGMKGQRVH